jgi:hypothetical protein
MRHFVADSVAHLKEQKDDQGGSVFKSQLLTILRIHPDSAAQHLKSSKSLHWLSKQLLGMGFKYFYCFFLLRKFRALLLNACLASFHI